MQSSDVKLCEISAGYTLAWTRVATRGETTFRLGAVASGGCEQVRKSEVDAPRDVILCRKQRRRVARGAPPSSDLTTCRRFVQLRLIHRGLASGILTTS